MFRRPHHQRVARVLSSLDASRLAEHQCWFGGGTAIALANDEYRESVDIDFLVSDWTSYRALRQIVRDEGLDGVSTHAMTWTRAPVSTQYAIRTAVLVADTTIKFEIIHEGRIELDVPPPEQVLCGVRTLSRADQVASKLLANDDRWADSSTFSRDLIDLAMMRPETAELVAGATKAVDAYGVTVGQALGKAIERVRERPQRLDECIEALQMEVTRATVWQAIRDLSAQCQRIDCLSFA